MKLILTGHDYAGKSTILQKLWEKENNGKMSYIHLSYREPTNRNFYDNTLEFSNFLMDRCFLDELIYPFVFGRKQNIDWHDAEALVQKCNDKGITLAIVTCDEDELRRRIKARTNIEEEPEVLQNILHIKNMYKDIAELYSLPIINTTGKTPDELVDEVYNLVKEDEKIHNIK